MTSIIINLPCCETSDIAGIPGALSWLHAKHLPVNTTPVSFSTCGLTLKLGYPIGPHPSSTALTCVLVLLACTEIVLIFAY